jgi:hypothetical protein
MIAYHQVVIKGKEKDLANIDFTSELSSVFRFFCNYGKIVDFNLEFLPNMIYVTYKQKSSVKKIIDAGVLEFINKSGVNCRFIASKLEYSLYVRNLKDSNKTYENFLARRQQQNLICQNQVQPQGQNQFNPFNTVPLSQPGMGLFGRALINTMDQGSGYTNPQMNHMTVSGVNVNPMEQKSIMGGGLNHNLNSGLNLTNPLSGVGSGVNTGGSFNYFSK